jgi:hypothetical protein
MGLQAALRLPMVGIKVWLEIEKIILFRVTAGATGEP